MSVAETARDALELLFARRKELVAELAEIDAVIGQLAEERRPLRAGPSRVVATARQLLSERGPMRLTVLAAATSAITGGKETYASQQICREARSGRLRRVNGVYSLPEPPP